MIIKFSLAAFMFFAGFLSLLVCSVLVDVIFFSNEIFLQFTQDR